MSYNQHAYRFYVVDVQKVCIDSGWEDRLDALERASALKEEGGTPVKVMTKPAVGTQKLPPDDEASWTPRRSSARMNPSTQPAPEPGSLWKLRKRDRHNRIYEVRRSDGVRVWFLDVMTREPFILTLDAFLNDFAATVDDPLRKNPAWKSRTGASRFMETVEYRGRYYVVSTNIMSPEMLARGESFSSEYPEGQETLVFPATSPTADKDGQYESTEVFGVRGAQSHKRALEHLEDAYRRDLEREAERAEEQRVEMDDMRENPGELVIVNPDDGGHDSARAEKVYEMWHKKEPHSIDIKKTGCDEEDEMVCIGKAHDIVYRSGKWEKGRKTNDYVHTFDSKPSVYMCAHLVDDERRGSKTVASLLNRARNRDGFFAVADLATPISFSLEDESEIAIHSGARVYGAVDKKTVIILDPKWKLIIIRGGAMHFDERGIVK